jgi:hypothetical protein
MKAIGEYKENNPDVWTSNVSLLIILRCSSI